MISSNHLSSFLDILLPFSHIQPGVEVDPYETPVKIKESEVKFDRVGTKSPKGSRQ